MTSVFSDREKRLGALSLWLVAIALSFAPASDRAFLVGWIPLDIGWDLPPSLTVFGALLVLIVVAGPTGSLRAVGFLLATPLQFAAAVLIRAVRLPVRILQTMVRVPQWLRRSAWSVPVVLLFAVYCSIVIYLTREAWVLWTSVMGLNLATMTLSFVVFAWVLDGQAAFFARAFEVPVRVLVQSYVEYYVGTLFPEKGGLDESAIATFDEFPKTTAARRARLMRWMGALISPRAAVLSFLAILVALFMVIVASFSFQYLASWKLDAGAFGPVARSPNLIDTGFFSFCTMMTVEHSDLRPSSHFCRLLVCLQLMHVLIVVSLLALSFSILHSDDLEHARQRLGQMESFLVERERDLLDVMSMGRRLFQLPMREQLQRYFAESKAGSPGKRWLDAIGRVKKRMQDGEDAPTRRKEAGDA